MRLILLGTRDWKAALNQWIKSLFMKEAYTSMRRFLTSVKHWNPISHPLRVGLTSFQWGADPRTIPFLFVLELKFRESPENLWIFKYSVVISISSMFLAKRENMGVNSSRTSMNLINMSTGEVRVSARPSSVLSEEYAIKYLCSGDVCGGLTLADHQNCSVTPLLSWTGERKFNKRLVFWDQSRERSLNNYCHWQNRLDLGENYFNLLPIKLK